MKRLLLSGIIFLSGTCLVLGQSCPQTLRLARSTYEQGRLHELEGLLSKCLGEGGFNQAERVDAYRLLTLAYIYLEEPDKADETMLKLIQTDHYYRPNEQVEPAEFIALYKTFRTRPIYRFGGKAGVITTQPNVANSQKAGPGTAEYNFSFSFTGGASFEIPWKDNKNGTPKFTLNPELFFSMQAFDFANSNTVASGEFSTDAAISLKYVSIPLVVQYSVFPKETLLNPFVSAGAAPEYLLSATTEPGRKLAGNQPVETKAYNTTNQFEKFNVSVLVGAGIKMKFGGGHILAELRYKYGLMNCNKPSSSYQIPDVAWDYHYMDSIFKLNALQLTVGYVHNIFSPKKLTVKK